MIPQAAEASGEHPIELNEDPKLEEMEPATFIVVWYIWERYHDRIAGRRVFLVDVLFTKKR